MTILINETVSADKYTVRIRPTRKRTIAGAYKANPGGVGTLVATLVLETSTAKNPEALEPGEIGWVTDANSSFPSTIASGAETKDTFNFSNANNRWYRILVDVSSGSGAVVLEVNNEDMPT
jgi:hypothetical protein